MHAMIARQSCGRAGICAVVVSWQLRQQLYEQVREEKEGTGGFFFLSGANCDLGLLLIESSWESVKEWRQKNFSGGWRQKLL